MLTLVRQDEKETKKSEHRNHKGNSNVISFASKAKTTEKSQKNVLAAAKKLRW